MAVVARVVKWRPLPEILGVDVSFISQQYGHAFNLPLFTSHVKRSAFLLVHPLYLSPVGKQKLDDVYMVVECGKMERRLLLVGVRIHVGSTLDEDLSGFEVSTVCCVV